MSALFYTDTAYQLATADTDSAPTLWVISHANSQSWHDGLSAFHQQILASQNITLSGGTAGLLLDETGHIAMGYLIVTDSLIWQAAAAAHILPAQPFALAAYGDDLSAADLQQITLGFALAQYQVPKEGVSRDVASLTTGFDDEIAALYEGISFCRDLINAPANQMTPAQLADEAVALAHHYGANCEVITGAACEARFPALHTVGRAAEIGPRLIDFSWGETGPAITLVGKGITFDSGGLDLKPSKAMEMMKKDMGGAAHVLGLAAVIMHSQLPVRLRVLIAAAENAVSEKAMRPMDVIDTAAGIKVEVGNTDAEGRLVLADALDLAIKDKPDFLLDFATLTGAARVALGTECPALFCNEAETAQRLMACGLATDDPVWQLPLFEPYDRFLDAGHMALSSTGQSGYGGAITAALFLRRFTGKEVNWAHIDVMAWNLSSRPGRPRGGEAMGLRACYSYIKELAAG